MQHANLRLSTPERARAEIVDSKRYIEDITGASCTVFAPPRGAYRRSHLGMVRDAGYLGMRTVELMNIGHPVLCLGIAVLPTSLQVYPHHAAAYLRNAVKRFHPGNLITYLAHARGASLRLAAESLITRVVEDGGVFHLWGHSWELEEKGLWPVLEDILMSLRACAGRCRMVSNATLCEEALRHESAAGTVSHPELS